MIEGYSIHADSVYLFGMLNFFQCDNSVFPSGHGPRKKHSLRVTVGSSYMILYYFDIIY